MKALTTFLMLLMSVILASRADECEKSTGSPKQTVSVKAALKCKAAYVVAVSVQDLSHSTTTAQLQSVCVCVCVMLACS